MWQKEAACGNLCGMFYVYARNNALNNTNLLLAAHLSNYYIFFPSLTKYVCVTIDADEQKWD